MVIVDDRGLQEASVKMQHSTGPTVLYVAGSGRSGSTLLERVLGAIPGFVNVGELIDLFRRVHPNNERCGCGVPFRDCSFWTKVGDVAMGGWSASVVSEMTDLQRSVARQRHIPRHLKARPSPAFRSATSDYQRRYRGLYQAIADVAGARVVVDASKWPAQALALSRSPVDLRVVHMLRDVRGVAWSLSRRAVSRPHVTNGSDRMFSAGVLSASGAWALCQEEVALLRRRDVPMSVLRYEDLVSAPFAQVSRVLEEVGLVTSMDQLSHLDGDRADLRASHGLSGNPSRFSGGVTRLRLDDEWRTGMPRFQRVALGAVQASASRRPATRRRTLAPVRSLAPDQS